MPAPQKLVVRGFMMSVDGLAAGPNQRLDQPFGDHTEDFTDWVFATRTGRQMIGQDGGDEGLDDQVLSHAFDGIGATLLGRNMFTTSRGPWTDDGWTGWWGPNPPYHCPTFVLTHHARDPIPMEGGTTFVFSTSGIHDTLEQAFAAADGRDVRLMGGAATVRQYLAAGLVDDLHLAIVPMLIGRGEPVFGLDTPLRHYECVEHVSSPSVTHVRFVRR